jgi:hypothetical protein
MGQQAWGSKLTFSLVSSPMTDLTVDFRIAIVKSELSSCNADENAIATPTRPTLLLAESGAQVD